MNPKRFLSAGDILINPDLLAYATVEGGADADGPRLRLVFAAGAGTPARAEVRLAGEEATVPSLAPTQRPIPDPDRVVRAPRSTDRGVRTGAPRVPEPGTRGLRREVDGSRMTPRPSDPLDSGCGPGPIGPSISD
jgi:hypothetical protein